MRKKIIIEILAIILLSACNNKPSNLTLEKYCQTLLNDSITTKYKGYVYGCNRDNRNYVLMFPDTTQVFYNIDTNDKLNIISIDSHNIHTDSLIILQKVKELSTYVNNRRINIIDCNEMYMEVVFDLSIINHKEVSENQGVLIFCYGNAELISKIGKISFHNPKEICPKVFYYEYTTRTNL